MGVHYTLLLYVLTFTLKKKEPCLSKTINQLVGSLE